MLQKTRAAPGPCVTARLSISPHPTPTKQHRANSTQARSLHGDDNENAEELFEIARCARQRRLPGVGYHSAETRNDAGILGSRTSRPGAGGSRGRTLRPVPLGSFGAQQ